MSTDMHRNNPLAQSPTDGDFAKYVQAIADQRVPATVGAVNAVSQLSQRKALGTVFVLLALGVAAGAVYWRVYGLLAFAVFLYVVGNALRTVGQNPSTAKRKKS